MELKYRYTPIKSVNFNVALFICGKKGIIFPNNHHFFLKAQSITQIDENKQQQDAYKLQSATSFSSGIRPNENADDKNLMRTAEKNKHSGNLDKECFLIVMVTLSTLPRNGTPLLTSS